MSVVAVLEGSLSHERLLLFGAAFLLNVVRAGSLLQMSTLRCASVVLCRGRAAQTGHS